MNTNYFVHLLQNIRERILLTSVLCSTDTSVTTVNAKDCDGSAPNNDVFYLIARGGNDQFKINSTSGDITTITKLDRETTANYSLVVLAVDRGSPSRTASATVSVDVINVNDDPPKFQSDVVTVMPQEEERPGSLVSRFTAGDGDEDALLQYTVLWNHSQGFSDNQTLLSTADLQVCVIELAFPMLNWLGLLFVFSIITSVCFKHTLCFKQTDSFKMICISVTSRRDIF